MRRYPALKAIAVLVKIFAALGVFIGFLTLFLSIGEDSISPISPYYGILSFVSSIIAGFFLWAIAELIMVFVGLGEDVSRLVNFLQPQTAETSVKEPPAPIMASTSTNSTLDKKDDSSSMHSELQSQDVEKICANCKYYVNTGTLIDKYTCEKGKQKVNFNNTCDKFLPKFI